MGTALKTIIARFQELSDSTEALEDGIDANKVEKALKQADVALRDSTGQFRDFDDVIMELSSKWDTLDRNTQRYIATIAAGSRQQSRFIALVEDYDRNVELIAMAQDSAGAGAAQFNTQLTGLQASMNRLQSAWESLYLSINGAPIFSLLIDSTAGLVQNLGDLGLGFTTLSAAAIFAFSRIAIASAASATKVIAGEAAKGTAIAAVTAGLNAQAKAARASLIALAPVAVSAGAIIAGILALGTAIYGLNKALNADKIAIRETTEELQKYEGQLGAVNQEISTLESLQKELDTAYEKHEDLTEIKTKILEQAPEIANQVNVETASYQELTSAMQDYLREKQKEASYNAIQASKTDLELAKKEKEILMKELDNKITFSQDAARTNALVKGPYLTKDNRYLTFEEINRIQTEGTAKEKQKLEQDLENAINITDKYYYNGVYYNTKEEVSKAILESSNELAKLNQEIQNKSKISLSTLKIVASDQANLLGVENVQDAEKIISLLMYGVTPDDFDESGNLITEIENLSKENIEKISNFSKNLLEDKSQDPELQKAWSSLLNGDYNELSQNQINDFDQLGLDIEQLFPDLYEDYESKKNQLTEKFAALGLEASDAMSINFMENWISKINDSDEEIRDLYKNIFSAIGDEDFLSNFSEEDQAIFSQLTGDTEGLIQALAALSSAGIKTGNDLYDSIVTILRETSDTATAASQNVKEFYSQLEQLSSGVSEGLDLESVMDMIIESEGKLQATDFSFDPLTGKWKIREESAIAYIDTLKELQLEELQEAKSATVAAMASNEVERQTLTAALAQLKGADAASQATEANGNLAKIITILNKEMGVQVTANEQEIDSIVNSTKARQAQIAELESQLDANRKNGDSLLQNYELLNNQIDALQNFTGAQYLANEATSSGSKSTNEATDAAKAYADALKEQAEALKAAAEAEQKRIEQEINGIKKVLEARKKSLEEQNELIQEQIDKEKESQEILLEAYLKYLEQRKNEYQESLDEMEKAAEEAREKADEDNENLTFTNQIAQDYYENEIALIDEKIKALEDEAEAEDRLQKLQEARDAYERAKNTKNRLVLVQGAGWVFKRDQSEIEDAQKELADAKRENEIANLNKQKESLQEQADLWAQQAENIGKTTEELEKYNKAYEEFSKMTEEERSQALKEYIDALIKNNNLNQDALDKENAFADQNDETKEGSLAWNIKKVEELSDKTQELIDQINKSAEELIKDNQINQVVESLDKMLGEKGIEGLTNHLDTLTKGVNSYIENFLKLSEQMSSNEEAIEQIDSALEDWDELLENLGKSQSELNQELAIFNKYNQLTNDELKKSSAIYQDITNQLSNLADQWDRVNAAQAAYEAAQDRADAIGKSIEGYETGGVNTYTGLAMVHGTKSRPEVFLNNSQASALFNFIDGLVKTPLNFKKNNPALLSTANSISEDNSVNYTNCKFEIISKANDLDKLLQDVKNRSPLVKF